MLTGIAVRHPVALRPNVTKVGESGIVDAGQVHDCVARKVEGILRVTKGRAWRQEGGSI